jgi:hypothetical protein
MLHPAAALCLLALQGCVHAPKPLYYWESFPKQQYTALLREAVSPDEQIRIMEAQADKARASSAALPPGFRAHLGMLYLGAGKPQRARELWTAEMNEFPESALYMNRLLKRLDAPGESSNVESLPL